MPDSKWRRWRSCPRATDGAASVALVWSAHISWLFSEYPYIERVAAARRSGFEWIETAWPEEVDAAHLPAAVAENGVRVALLNCPAGDTRGGERGFINDPERQDEAQQSFLAAADLAERIGARNLNLLVGRALPTRTSVQLQSIVQALRSIGPQAAKRGLRILLEPINAVENPGYLAPTPMEAVRLIERSGSDAVGLLLDLYHLAWIQTDPLAAIDDFVDLIGHVQVSDWPGRGAPGTGRLDLRAALERLQERGYAGAVGLEYAPVGSTEASLAFLGVEPAWPPGLAIANRSPDMPR
jgi:hydroxypyruvate isomerase